MKRKVNNCRVLPCNREHRQNVTIGGENTRLDNAINLALKSHGDVLIFSKVETINKNSISHFKQSQIKNVPLSVYCFPAKIFLHVRGAHNAKITMVSKIITRGLLTLSVCTSGTLGRNDSLISGEGQNSVPEMKSNPERLQ